MTSRSSCPTRRFDQQKRRQSVLSVSVRRERIDAQRCAYPARTRVERDSLNLGLQRRVNRKREFKGQRLQQVGTFIQDGDV